MAHKVIHSSVYRAANRLFVVFIVFILFTTLGVKSVFAGVNIEPTLDPISNQTILEDSSATSVPLSGISAGIGDVGQSLTVTASSSNPSILPDPTVTYTSPEMTGSLSLAPIQNIFGEVDVTVTVQDDGGTADGGDDSFSQTFHVIITPVNDPPSFVKGSDPTIAEDIGLQTIPNWATQIQAGPGETGQLLTFQLSPDKPALFSVSPAIDPINGTLTFTPALNANGITTVTTILKDNGGTENVGSDTFSTTFTITITPVNDPPVIASFAKNGTRGKSLAFSLQDFLDVYSDVEANPLAGIKIVSLPSTGQLTLDAAAIPADTEIPVGQLGKLTFVPSSGWYGSTSFSWSAADGQDYSTLPAAVTINYPYSPLFEYLPIIMVPLPDPPLAFVKTAPTNKATAQPNNPILDWQDSTGTTDYQYCYDSIINSTCDGSWLSAGIISQVQLSGLNYSTKYEWHVRAYNLGGTTYSNGSTTAYYSFTTVPPPPWVTVFSENFEGTFPGGWDLSSYYYEGGAYYDVTSEVSWGKRNCKKASGSYGGWAVGGGAAGISCSESYPYNLETWMVYGPFDLTQVKDGRLSLKVWSDIEPNFYDKVAWGVSVDNKNYYGTAYSGNSGGWISQTIDLKNVYMLGNVIGNPQVWIGTWFISDDYNLYYEEGAAVDNIILSTCASTIGCTGTPPVSAMSELPNSFQAKPIIGTPHVKSINPRTLHPSSVLSDPWLSWIKTRLRP